MENHMTERNQTTSSGTDHQEIEWQFEAADLERVRSWLEEPTKDLSILVGPYANQELVDTYYDTEDWRLYRAGYALRARRQGQEGEATMKSLATGDGQGNNSRRRREISQPLEDGEVGPLPKARGLVSERLRALVDAHDLRCLFEIRTHRWAFDLLLGERAGALDEGSASDPSGRIVQDASGEIRRGGTGGGARVGELTLDSSEIPLGDGEVARLARVEIEVEAFAADIAGLEEFAKAMEGELSLRPTAISKYEAGLFATGQSPEGDSKLGPDFVDGSLSAGEVAFAVLRRQFAIMRAHEAGTRLGEDPEELHDMRVAMRRMRAAIKLFQDALPERARWFRDELKFFAGVIGEVRDLEVQIEQLEGWAAQADEEKDLEALSEVVTALEVRRAGARERLLEALDSARYKHFEASFAEMLRRGPAGEAIPGREPAAADAPILTVAPDLLSRPYRKWRKAAKRINDGSYPEEYHDLRKKGKRLRYALEFLSDVYGKEATDKLVKPLKKLQDDLGEHQDLIVASDLLEELVTHDLPPRMVFAMGILAGRYRQEATDLRATVPASKSYRDLTKGKAWKDFEKVMKKWYPKAEDGKKG